MGESFPNGLGCVVLSRSQQVVVREREVAAIDLRREGLTYGEIAERLGYSDGTGARNAVVRGLDRALREPADELRELEAARLDRAQVAIWPGVLSGDVKNVLALIKIMERRARLLGLDAPLRVSGDVTVFEGGDVDREVQRLAELLAGVGEAHRGGFEDGVGGSAGSS